MYDNENPGFLSPERSEKEIEEFKDTDPPQEQMKYLYNAVNRISSEQSAVKNQLTTIERFMARLDEKVFGDETRGKGRAESSSTHQPMTISRSTDLRFDPMFPPRSELYHLANRERMLKKIELPMFDGENVYEWIVLVERFFRIGRYTEEEMLEMVALSLSGKVLKWSSWELQRSEFLGWSDFKKRLLRRFGESIEDEPGKRLFALKQTGFVSDYVSEFEDLSAQVSGLDDHNLTDIFYKGLKQEMKEVIHMKEPRGLRETIAAVMRMESSFFCKAMSEVTKVETKGARTTASLPLRTSSHYNSQRTFQNSDKKLTESGVGTQGKGNVSTGFQELRPRQQYTNAELDEMRRNKICFKCKGKYFKDHPCNAKELRVMTVVNGIDMGVLDDWEAQSEHDMEGQVNQQLMQNILVVAKFQVKHKWRFKKFSRVSDIINKRELQPHGSYRGSNHIIFAISSLWASLFSWGKVCKIKLTRKRTRTWWLQARFQYLSKSVMMSQVKNEVRFKNLKSVSDLAIVDRWSLTRMDIYLAWGQVVAREGGKLCPRKRRICLVYGSIGCFFILQLMGMRDKVQHVLTYNGYLKFKTIKRESGSIGEKLWVKPLVGYCMKHGSKKSGSQVWHRWKIKTAKLHNVLACVLVKLIIWQFRQEQKLARIIRALATCEGGSGLCLSSTYTFNKYYCGKRYIWRTLGMKLFLFTTSSFLFHQA